MRYQEIECKSALHKLRSGRLPFSWDLNIYRGCAHQCRYCYAIYSQKYFEDNDFYKTIYIKKNIAFALEKQLSSRTWKHEVINIGGVTDSYQPIEHKMQLMREVLKVMIKYQNPIVISTKSDLILRDIELINQLSKVTDVNIAATITTMDEGVSKIIESGAVTSARRFEMLKEVKEKTNATVGVHLMPIIPYITDSYNNLEEIYKKAKEINVDYVLPGVMYLRGETKSMFLNFIKKEFPNLYLPIVELYQYGSLNQDYRSKIYHKVDEILKEYPITQTIPQKQKPHKKYKQLSLFE